MKSYKFSNYENNTFTLLLQKVVYPHYYMHDSEKLNERSLSEKEES